MDGGEEFSESESLSRHGARLTEDVGDEEVDWVDGFTKPADGGSIVDVQLEYMCRIFERDREEEGGRGIWRVKLEETTGFKEPRGAARQVHRPQLV